MRKIPERLLPEIRYALEKDSGFDFRNIGKYLEEGICPKCGKRRLFVGLESPYVVKCNRRNSCAYEASIFELYPDIFSNISKRFPVTPDNPNAPTDAYLRTVRGFDLSKIKGMYEFGRVKNKFKEEYYSAVQVANHWMPKIYLKR